MADDRRPLPTLLPGPGEGPGSSPRRVLYREQSTTCPMCGGVHDEDLRPIEMPVPGPGVPRYTRVAPGWAVWLIPAGVVLAAILVILCGVLWR